MRRSAAWAVRVGSVAACGVILTAAAGCYERVVGAKGLGADQYGVQEPYQEQSAVDRWIWGDDAKDQARSGPTTKKP
jgi:hypothetical protein